MIVVHADVFAQVPHRDSVREAMLVAQRAAQLQDGCLSYRFAEAIDEPGHFLAVERWRDAQALEAHFRSDAFTAYQNAVTPLLVRDSEVLMFDAEQQVRPIGSSPLDLRQDD